MSAVLVTEAMTKRAFEATAAQKKPKDGDVFREGDVVVYSAHGVGKIDRIGSEIIAGHTIDIIQVSFGDNQMTVRVPAAKARAAGLRKLSSPEAVAKALGVLTGNARSSKLMWAKRVLDYQSKINSGNPILLAELLRDLRRNADGTEGSYSERNIFEIALARLASEIAAVEGIDQQEAVAKIYAQLRSIRGGGDAAAAEPAVAAAVAAPAAEEASTKAAAD
jgi:CarD family transcriptional regulator